MCGGEITALISQPRLPGQAGLAEANARSIDSILSFIKQQPTKQQQQPFRFLSLRSPNLKHLEAIFSLSYFIYKHLLIIFFREPAIGNYFRRLNLSTGYQLEQSTTNIEFGFSTRDYETKANISTHARKHAGGIASHKTSASEICGAKPILLLVSSQDRVNR